MPTLLVNIIFLSSNQFTCYNISSFHYTIEIIIVAIVYDIVFKNPSHIVFCWMRSGQTRSHGAKCTLPKIGLFFSTTSQRISQATSSYSSKWCDVTLQVFVNGFITLELREFTRKFEYFTTHMLKTTRWSS